MPLFLTQFLGAFNDNLFKSALVTLITFDLAAKYGLNAPVLITVVAGLFIGSSVVYYARIQPVIFGIPIIGFIGYLVAFVLGVWVAHDVIRESRRRRRR